MVQAGDYQPRLESRVRWSNPESANNNVSDVFYTL